MKLKDIKASVRKLLQDDQYDGDVIMQAANWFVYELANNNKLRQFESSAELSAAKGDTAIAFPSAAIAWTSIHATTPIVYDLTDNYVEYKDFMRSYANFASSAAAKPGNWTMFGNGMRLSAPLLTDVTLQFDFVGEPTPMARDTDTCAIPSRYAELVARGTKARILEIEEDYDYAQQERDALEPLVTAFVRNEARGGGKTKPTIIGTGRRRGRNSGGIPRLGE